MKEPKILNNMYLDGEIRESILLQQISTEPINILIIGDPGTGKTTLLKSAFKLSQNSFFSSREPYERKTKSNDDIMIQMLKTAEILVLDDIDHFNEEDHQFTNSICDRGMRVLASSKPKWGRFNPYDFYVTQISIPQSLLGKFDLIFTLSDYPNKEKDRKIVEKILNPKKSKDEDLTHKIKQIKEKKANISIAAKEAIKKYYLKKRKQCNKKIAITITTNQINTLIKLTKAYAKLRGAKTANKQDANKAIRIINYYLDNTGIDPETGLPDIDRATARITAKEREKIRKIIECINEMSTNPDQTIPIEDLIVRAANKGIDVDDALDIIEILKSQGEICEPKEGCIKKI